MAPRKRERRHGRPGTVADRPSRRGRVAAAAVIGSVVMTSAIFAGRGWHLGTVGIGRDWGDAVHGSLLVHAIMGPVVGATAGVTASACRRSVWHAMDRAIRWTLTVGVLVGLLSLATPGVYLAPAALALLGAVLGRVVAGGAHHIVLAVAAESVTALLFAVATTTVIGMGDVARGMIISTLPASMLVAAIFWGTGRLARWAWRRDRVVPKDDKRGPG